MALNTKYSKILLLILLIALIIRLLGINQPFNEDELHWAFSAETNDWFGSVMRNAPLSVYLMNSVTSIFGVHVWSIRLTFILVGLLTLLVTAKFANAVYGSKISLISAFLLAVSPLHVLGSLQAAYEGSVLALFFVVVLFFIFKYAEIGQKKFVYLAGVAFGFALLSKTSAFLLILPIILFYVYVNKRNLVLAVVDSFKVFFIGVLLFVVGFALPSVFVQSPALINSVTQLVSQAGAVRSGLLSLVFQYVYALVWIGPLFVLAFVWGVFNRKIDSLNLIAVVYVVLFYLLVIREGSPPIERYFMVLLPSLAIVSAVFINAVFGIFVKKKFVVVLFFAVFFLGVLFNFVLNFQQGVILPFYPKTEFVSHFFDLSWNFLVPITGSSGPLGFYVNFETIGFVFFASFFLFLLGLIVSTTMSSQIAGKKIFSLFSVLLIAVSLAYNFFFVSEYLLSLTHPDINMLVWETVDYVNSNNFNLPVYYFKNYALFYHFDGVYKKTINLQLPKFDYFNLSEYESGHLKDLRRIASGQPMYGELIPLSFVDDDEERTGVLFQKIQKYGASIVFIDFPAISKGGFLWRAIIENCRQVKSFADKNEVISYVFVCSGQQGNP